MKSETQNSVNLAAPQTGDVHGSTGRTADGFFDGGWCWMRHPNWNIGNAIPVFMYAVGADRYYVPLDPSEGGEFAWDERDPEWEIVEHAMAAADAEFDAYCARVAGGHLANLVDELRASQAALVAALVDVIGWVPGRAAWHTDAPIEAVARARAALAAASAP